MSLSSTSSVVAVDALLVRDVDGQYRPARAEEVLSQARRVLSQRVRRGATMSSPQAVKDYLRLEIGVLEHEVFCVLFLDAQHRIIELKQMFRGTVTQTSVYPREVVKEALGLFGGKCACGIGLAAAQGLAHRGQVVQAARLHSSPRSAKYGEHNIVCGTWAPLICEVQGPTRLLPLLRRC